MVSKTNKPETMTEKRRTCMRLLLWLLNRIYETRFCYDKLLGWTRYVSGVLFATRRYDIVTDTVPVFMKGRQCIIIVDMAMFQIIVDMTMFQKVWVYSTSMSISTSWFRHHVIRPTYLFHCRIKYIALMHLFLLYLLLRSLGLVCAGI